MNSAPTEVEEAVARVIGALETPNAILSGGTFIGGVIRASDLSLILPDYARLQSESAKGPDTTDLDRLEAGLRPFADKLTGSLRIGVDEVRTILALIALARRASPEQPK